MDTLEELLASEGIEEADDLVGWAHAQADAILAEGVPEDLDELLVAAPVSAPSTQHTQPGVPHPTSARELTGVPKAAIDPGSGVLTTRSRDEGSGLRVVPNREGSQAGPLPRGEGSGLRVLPPVPRDDGSGVRSLPSRSHEGSGLRPLPTEGSGLRTLPSTEGSGVRTLPPRPTEGSGLRPLPPRPDEGSGMRAMPTNGSSGLHALSHQGDGEGEGDGEDELEEVEMLDDDELEMIEDEPEDEPQPEWRRALDDAQSGVLPLPQPPADDADDPR